MLKIILNLYLVLSFVLLSTKIFAEEARIHECTEFYAIAPPLTKDVLTSDALAKRVADELGKRGKTSCGPESIVPQDETRDAFDRIGMNSSFSLEPDRLFSSQLEFLGEELGATHLVFVRLLPDRDTIRVDIRKLINNDRALSKERFEFELPYRQTIASLPKSKRWVAFLAPLAANSMTIGLVTTELQLDLSDGYRTKSTKTQGIIPPIVSSISINKIEHYRSYRMFDYAFSLFPGSFLFAVDQDSEIEHVDKPMSDPSKTQTVHMEAYGGCATVIAEGSIHTPLGTTHVGYGLGPCAIQKRQERRDPVLYGTFASRIEMGHRAFFSEKWYAYFDVDMLMFTGSPIYQSDVVKSNQVTRGGFGIGYYRANSEGIFTSVWQ